MAVPAGFEFHLWMLTDFFQIHWPIPLEMLINERKVERVSGPPEGQAFPSGPYGPGLSSMAAAPACHWNCST
jgi:hypothetical protein